MSDALKFRAGEAGEIEELARLVAHSFPGAQRTPAWLQDQLRDPPFGGGAETLVVGEQAGRPVAACQIHPFRQFVGGVALPMAGVGTVAVAPTHRRRRIAAELVAAALRAAHERGDVVSALYPFRTEFYARLGYGQADLAHQYQIAPDQLRDSPERLRVELLDGEAARGEALALYHRWAQSQTGQLERSARLWRELCTESDRVLVGHRRAEDGELDGYALVSYRVEPPPAARWLDVDELVWIGTASRSGLYGWLSSLGDQWHQLVLRARPSERLGDWIREPRLPRGAAPMWRLWAPGATLMYGTMTRIVNVPAAWERRRVNAASSLVVTFEVADAQLAENSGAWRVELADGRASVRRGASADATLRLDIATLSRIYMGAITPAAALAAGLLECDRPDVLEPLGARLALPEPWTFDRF